MRAGVVNAALPLFDAADRLSLARKAASYIRQAALPMPDRLERYNYLRLMGEERILHPDFLSKVDRDRPLALKRELYATLSADSMVNRMLGLDFTFTLADSDLPKVRTMCARSGMEVRFPFLANKLIDFAADIPVPDKVTRRQLRGFYKAAMREFLPPAVIAKQKHGFGLPFGMWLTSHSPLREYSYALLDGSAQRRFVRRSFVDELKDSLVPSQPRYYGPLVWLLVVAELWHQRTEVQTCV
jgi:asparagine synthase (glutamine-hydrolysing)